MRDGFGRVEPRRQARAFLLGLLSDVDTRSSWQPAEMAEDAWPHRMQRLLGEAVWEADAMRDDVRGYVEAHGDPDGVLILDDTGDLRGASHRGVQRHYTRTAGRIENARIAVFCGYATSRGYSRSTGRSTCRGAGLTSRSDAPRPAVADEVRLATKIALAGGYSPRAGCRHASLVGHRGRILRR